MAKLAIQFIAQNKMLAMSAKEFLGNFTIPSRGYFRQSKLTLKVTLKCVGRVGTKRESTSEKGLNEVRRRYVIRGCLEFGDRCSSQTELRP